MKKKSDFKTDDDGSSQFVTTSTWKSDPQRRDFPYRILRSAFDPHYKWKSSPWAAHSQNRVEDVAFSVVQCSAVQRRQPISLTRFTSDKSLRERHVLGGHINDITCPLSIDVTKTKSMKNIYISKGVIITAKSPIFIILTSILSFFFHLLLISHWREISVVLLGRLDH